MKRSWKNIPPAFAPTKDEEIYKLGYEHGQMDIIEEIHKVLKIEDLILEIIRDKDD